MNIIAVLLIAVGLAMDAFAVSLGAGAAGSAKGGRAAFRLSFHFGLFQFFMPVIGWFVGAKFAWLVGAVDHWIAFGLLAFVGGRMIRGGWSGEVERQPADPSRGMTLVMLSVATSVDALAVGLSLAMLKVDIWRPSLVIGVVAASSSLLGLRLGSRLGERFGCRMELVGGAILTLIGLHVLVSHLVA